MRVRASSNIAAVPFGAGEEGEVDGRLGSIRTLIRVGRLSPVQESSSDEPSATEGDDEGDEGASDPGEDPAQETASDGDEDEGG